jgi:hypothetical protein
MTFESNSIAPELRALRSELASDPVLEAQRRVFSRLARSLPELAGSTSAELSAPEVAAKGSAAAEHLVMPKKLWLLGAFALGGVAGAGTHAALDEPTDRIVHVDRIASAREVEPARTAPIATAADEVSAAPIAAFPETPRAKRSLSPPEAPKKPLTNAAEQHAPTEHASKSASLGEQQALLDEARAALGRNDGHGALSTIEVHRARFPESVLAEEREALAVKALARTGNGAEARARLSAFELRFPRSPLLPSLRSVTRDSVTETKRPRQ